MEKKHFSSDKSEEPPSFRVTPLDIPLTSTLPRRSRPVHGKRLHPWRMRSSPKSPIPKGDQDKFRPFDSYHWDKVKGFYSERTGSTDEVADMCKGEDWLRQSEERHAEALSNEKRDLSDDVGASGQQGSRYSQSKTEVYAHRRSDHDKVGQTMESYLESLYNEWFNTQNRDERKSRREKVPDEMEILEGILRDSKSE